MQCARLNLQERTKPVVKQPPKVDKPRRYCQKRMVNPEHNEDPKWTDVIKRFHCQTDASFDKYAYYENESPQGVQEDDMVLTIQNLKFQGDVQEHKRPRTSFKFKSLAGNRTHRMFIREVVDEISTSEDDRISELTSYYFDDYVKYILSADRSRPSSSKSSIFLQDLSNKYKETKDTPVEKNISVQPKKTRKGDTKNKSTLNKKRDERKTEVTDENNEGEDIMQDTKVCFQKNGKRKSLTISRAQSPETIQIIRVDVVCNYSTSSALSEYEEDKNQSTAKLIEKDIEKIKFKTPHFADKYLLTNTVRSVNENLSCGSKVTLLCKTFKLSDRSKMSEKKYAKIVKDTSPKACLKKR